MIRNLKKVIEWSILQFPKDQFNEEIQVAEKIEQIKKHAPFIIIATRLFFNKALPWWQTLVSSGYITISPLSFPISISIPGQTTAAAGLDWAW